MASTTSRPSPNSSSPYDFESAPETEESWHYIDYTASSSGTSPLGFYSDPASGSLNSFTLIGHVTGNTPPPSAPSPLLLGEMEQSAFFTANTTFPPQSENGGNSDVFATTTDGGFGQATEYMTPQQYLFPQQQQQSQHQQQHDGSQFTQQDLNGMLMAQRNGSVSSQAADNSPDLALMNSFGTDLFQTNSNDQFQMAQLDFNVPQPLQSDPNVPPWNPTSPRALGENVFIMDDFNSASPTSMHSQASSSPGIRPSPVGSRSPSQIRKVRVGKVVKRKTDLADPFVIVTPDKISEHAGTGRLNPYECFEAMRTSQRGRKGPLANATKENALQVRRLGACFCCHSRKVKCDKERPCKSCKKLMISVPQVVCWQFQDFLPTLFPDFIRGHFRKDEMTSFIEDNIVGFSVDGVEQSCSVELYSGPRFSTVLAVEAKFFTPKTIQVMEHWHLGVGQNRVNLTVNRSAAIGIDFKEAGQRDKFKKKVKKYIQEIVEEPEFVEQVTDNFWATGLPGKLLRIVRQYAQETDSVMVKRALSIYCMHYIMTRHLCLTRGTVDSLQSTGAIPLNSSGHVTPRVLARQVKAIVDELMLREMQQLFELFSKSLKPKSRREWAPCTAAFLVLCLFMEAVETAADVFVVSQNEISFRSNTRLEYERNLALNTCKEVENMPFKQFAYQFHQVYQTHSKEPNAKSFNPLKDTSFAEQGELDQPAVTLATQLRELFWGEEWQELQFLAANDILPNEEPHPFPKDAQAMYTGRLVSRFLISFLDDKAIFGDSG